MTIRAKYSGKCRNCGGSIREGDMIEWERGGRATHEDCPGNATRQQASRAQHANAWDELKAQEGVREISRGEGYGGQPYTEGQILGPGSGEPGEPEAVIASRQYYIREDGLSFGVGDEEGHIYTALCRSLTDAERAAWDEHALVVGQRLQAGLDLKVLFDLIVSDGETIGSADQPVSIVGEMVPYPGEEQTLYGGGRWFVIEADGFVWAVRNNGADGDNWSHNNVRTGGAGAIGWRRADPEGIIEKELRGLVGTLNEPQPERPRAGEEGS